MPSTKCTMCSKPTKQFCCNCKSVWYCSPICQESDKPLHDLVCAKFATFFQNHPRPAGRKKVLARPEEIRIHERATENFVAAILLPADREYPEFVWLCVGYNEAGAASAPGEKKARVGPYIPGKQPYQPVLNNLSLVWTTTRNSRRVDILSAVKSKTSTVVTNKSLALLNNGYSMPNKAENIVIVHAEEFTTNDGEKAMRYGDVQACDLRYALNVICREHNSYYISAGNQFILRDAGSWTLGVRVNCMADLNAHLDGDISKKYEPVYLRHTEYDTNHVDDRVPPTITKQNKEHIIWGRKDPCPIAYGLGMPLKMVPFRCTDEKSCPNVGCAAVIRATIEPTDLSYFAEYIPMHTYMVVRSDKKDLTLNQFNVLLSFSFEVCRKLKKYRGKCSVRRRRAMEKLLYTDRFEQFFEAYKRAELSYGRMEWRDEVPPERINMGEPGPATRKYGWAEKEQV